MRKKKVIFTDHQIVEFCHVTRDTNEIHDPAFMEAKGKRVIVPGMLALASTINLSADFLKEKANYIYIHFNSLLSSGDFVTLCNGLNPDDNRELRISAINQKDTLSSNEEYSRMYVLEEDFCPSREGIIRSLDLDHFMVDTFTALTCGSDTEVSGFLFAVAYASQALLRSIDQPVTDVEKEIDVVINKNTRVSPFYHTLEIHVPKPFPSYIPEGKLDYLIHFTVEKPGKLYTAHVCCEHRGTVLFYSRYKMIGIPDMLIYRMAKEISHPRRQVI
jgi:hypothetical protein